MRGAVKLGPRVRRRVPRWVVVDEDLLLPTVVEYGERSERARVEARSRYRGHVTEVLSGRASRTLPRWPTFVLDALTE